MDKSLYAQKFQALYDTNPFVHLLGITIDEVGQGTVKNHLVVRDDLINMDGRMHGGVLISLVDNACGVCGRTMGDIVVTQSITTNLMHNIPVGDTAYARARMLHRGRTTDVMEVTATTSDGTTLCETIATMFVVGHDERFAHLWDDEEATMNGKWGKTDGQGDVPRNHS